MEYVPEELMENLSEEQKEKIRKGEYVEGAPWNIPNSHHPAIIKHFNECFNKEEE